jgi:hypothetical protein
MDAILRKSKFVKELCRKDIGSFKRAYWSYTGANTYMYSNGLTVADYELDKYRHRHTLTIYLWVSDPIEIPYKISIVNEFISAYELEDFSFVLRHNVDIELVDGIVTLSKNGEQRYSSGIKDFHIRPYKFISDNKIKVSNSLKISCIMGVLANLSKLRTDVLYRLGYKDNMFLKDAIRKDNAIRKDRYRSEIITFYELRVVLYGRQYVPDYDEFLIEKSLDPTSGTDVVMFTDKLFHKKIYSPDEVNVIHDTIKLSTDNGIGLMELCNSKLSEIPKTIQCKIKNARSVIN